MLGKFDSRGKFYIAAVEKEEENCAKYIYSNVDNRNRTVICIWADRD